MIKTLPPAVPCIGPAIELLLLEYLCKSIPEWIAHMEMHESRRGFGSHQLRVWQGLKVALNSDRVIGCCPLLALPPFSPSSSSFLFKFSLWDGISANSSEPVGFYLICASPEEQPRFSKGLQTDQIWFALTRRFTLDQGVRQEVCKVIQDKFKWYGINSFKFSMSFTS
jgi:hypothetical protein